MSVVINDKHIIATTSEVKLIRQANGELDLNATISEIKPIRKANGNVDLDATIDVYIAIVDEEIKQFGKLPITEEVILDHIQDVRDFYDSAEASEKFIRESRRRCVDLRKNITKFDEKINELLMMEKVKWAKMDVLERMQEILQGRVPLIGDSTSITKLKKERKSAETELADLRSLIIEYEQELRDVFAMKNKEVLIYWDAWQKMLKENPWVTPFIKERNDLISHKDYQRYWNYHYNFTERSHVLDEKESDLIEQQDNSAKPRPVTTVTVSDEVDHDDNTSPQPPRMVGMGYGTFQ